MRQPNPKPGNTLLALAGLGEVNEWSAACLKAVEVVRKAPGSRAAINSSYHAKQCAQTTAHFFFMNNPNYWENKNDAQK